MALKPVYIGTQSADDIRRTFSKLIKDYVGHTHDAADIVSGELDVDHGGTNIASYAAGDLLYASGATTLSKLALGTATYVLTAGASAPTWAAVPTQTSALLSATHTDTLTASVVRGDVIIGNSTPKWARLALGTSGYVLTAGATDVSWAVIPTQTSALLSATHTDTTAAAAVRGDIITGQGASPNWTRLAISVPAAGLMNYLGVANGDTEPAYKVLFDATVPTTIAEGASAAVGTATVAARRDHTHGAPSTWAPTAHNVLSASHGDSTTAAAVRGDVITSQGASPKWTRLAISVPGAGLMNYLGAANGDTEPGYKALFDVTVPTTIAESAAAATGTATVAARRDHTHGAPATWKATAHNVLDGDRHGDTTSGSATRGDVITAQGVSPKWTRLAISVPAAGLMNYLGTANGDTEPAYKALFDATVPGTIAEGAAAAAGTATVAARRDHTHGAPSTWKATAHNLLDGDRHGDSAAGTCTRGDIITAQTAAPNTKWTRLALGTSGYVLTAGATDASWAAIPTQTSALLSTTHTDTLADSVVRGDILVGNATPKWARLPKGAAAKNILRMTDANDPGWGTIDLASAAAVGTSILPTANGGTGIAYFTAAGPTAARIYTFPDAASNMKVVNAGTGVLTLSTGANNARTFTFPDADSYCTVVCTTNTKVSFLAAGGAHTYTLPDGDGTIFTTGGIIASSYGGTGANLNGALYGVPYFSVGGEANTVMGSTAAPASTTVLLHGNNAGAPTWSAVVAEDTSFSVTDKLLGRATAGAGAGEEITCTAAGRALLDDAAASNQCTTLGLGTADGPTFAHLHLTNGIVGCDGTGDAAATYVGEFATASSAVAANCPASGQWGNDLSIALSAGDWDISALADFVQNGATVTGLALGIGTASGNDAAGITIGYNAIGVPPSFGAAGYRIGGSIPVYRIRVSGATTFYLKINATYSVATPQYVGRITARRVR